MLSTGANIVFEHVVDKERDLVMVIETVSDSETIAPDANVLLGDVSDACDQTTTVLPHRSHRNLHIAWMLRRSLESARFEVAPPDGDH